MFNENFTAMKLKFDFVRICQGFLSILCFFGPFYPNISLAQTLNTHSATNSATNSTNSSAIFCRRIFPNRNSLHTVEDHSQNALSGIQRSYRIEPKPQFADVAKERQSERLGQTGPKAFEAFMPRGTRYFSNPSPNSEHPLMAGRLFALGGYSLRLNIPWPDAKGNLVATTTPLYAWVPKELRPDFLSSSTNTPNTFLVSENTPAVIWYIHGGGTPTADSMNASTRANFFNKRGIPVIAIAQPGHSDSTVTPMTSATEILEWNLRAMELVIPPNVPIILSGHSWGGEMALHAATNLKNPKLKRIAAFIAESPPVDVTLGGSPEERLNFEYNLELELSLRSAGKKPDPEGWVQRISPDDTDFLANHLENGKLNPVATWFMWPSFLDYSFRLLSKEERSHMKPTMVAMGEHDGLTFVGREKPGLKYFIRMFGDNFHLFRGNARTFKGTGRKSGHMIHENVVNIGGKDELDLYTREMNFINRYVIGNNTNEAEAQKTDVVQTAQASASSQSPVQDLLVKIWALYQNNFAFRSYLENSVGYISKPNENAVTNIVSRKIELESALRKFEKEKAQTDIDNKLALGDKSLELTHAFGLVIRPNLQRDPIWGPVESMEAESKIDFSQKRQKALEKYLEQVAQIKAQTDPTEVNSNLVEEISKIRVKFQNKSKKFPWANQIIDEACNLLRLDFLTFEVGRPTSGPKTNSYLDEIRALGFDSVETAKLHVIKRLEEVKNKRAISDTQIANQLLLLENVLQDLRVAYKNRSKELSRVEIENIQRIPRPEGIQEPRSASWELSLHKLSDSEKAERYGSGPKSLASFKAEFTAIITNLENELNKQSQLRVAEFKWPNGVSNPQEAQLELLTLREKAEDRFIPPGAPKELAYLVGQLDVEQNKFAEYQRQNRQLAAEISQLRDLHKVQMDLAQSLMPTENMLLRWKEHKTTSVEVTERTQFYHNKMKSLEESHLALAEATANYILNLRKAGQLTKENLLKLTPEIKNLTEEFITAKKNFAIALKNLRRARLLAALNGEIFSEKDPTGQVLKQAMTELIGSSDFVVRGLVDPNSLEARLQSKRQEYDQNLYLVSEGQARLGQIKVALFKRMPKEHQTKNSYAFEWTRVFDQPFEKVFELLSQPKGSKGNLMYEALQSMFNSWESSWSEQVLVELNFPHSTWYSLATSKGRGEGPFKIEF